MTLEEAKIRLIMELRREGITDTRVLAAMERAPREMFVPPDQVERAYDNVALPIGHGQTISQPLVVAAMTAKLDVGPRMKLLEIGTGSGYQTAVLSPLCRRIYTIERDRRLFGEAEKRFAALRLTNVVTWLGDGNRGWPEQAPFDRIMVTAAAPELPLNLVDQLAIGGLMVIPIGAGPDDQELVCIKRTGDGFERERMFAVRFVPLVAERRIDGLAG